MKLQAIVFDFDGVICDSVALKVKAFVDLYEVFGQEIAHKVGEHHRNNGGISRYVKFRLYHKEFLGIDLTDQQVHELAQNYSDLVKKAVIDAPYIDGVDDFIKKNYQKYDFYISTGTPEPEIREIVEAKGLQNYFLGVYGSPDKKTSHLQHILSEKKYALDTVLFVGDAPTDRDAARSAGIQFVARIDGSGLEGSDLLKNEAHQLKDFKDFEHFLNTRF